MKISVDVFTGSVQGNMSHTLLRGHFALCVTVDLRWL